MNLSIVIPVFRESKKVEADIKSASRFLADNRFSGEIIVADDGSDDDTSDVAKNLADSLPEGISLRVIRNNEHRGKGFAIRQGMKQTSGEYVMFADSGCCVPYENALRGLQLLKNDKADIAHGSRKLPESKIRKPQSPYRRICSAFFHWFIVFLMRIPPEITDSQCGFKIYRGDIARQLYSECITDGFMFDVEIIKRAQMAGCRIKEFPVEWACDRDSRLSPTRTLPHILSELIAIRQNVGKKQV